MSTTIDQAFVRDYEKRVHDAFQRMGAKLKGAVRFKGDVVGKSTTFQIIGKGAATTKARHGQITPMNQTHSNVECTFSDFYAGDWVDALDEAKTNIDERDAIARGGAYALGRKCDDQIITELGTTTQTAVTWTVTTELNIRKALFDMCEALDGNDVPNDGERYAALTSKGWAMANTVNAFANADYVGADGLPLKEGAPVGMRWKYWNGVLWTVHTGLANHGESGAVPLIWHKTAIGYGACRHAKNVAGNNTVAADITWHGDRAAHFVNHMMSGGAKMIEDAGVIKGSIDDTANVPVVAST